MDSFWVDSAAEYVRASAREVRADSATDFPSLPPPPPPQPPPAPPTARRRPPPITAPPGGTSHLPPRATPSTPPAPLSVESFFWLLEPGEVGRVRGALAAEGLDPGDDGAVIAALHELYPEPCATCAAFTRGFEPRAVIGGDGGRLTVEDADALLAALAGGGAYDGGDVAGWADAEARGWADALAAVDAREWEEGERGGGTGGGAAATTSAARPSASAAAAAGLLARFRLAPATDVVGSSSGIGGDDVSDGSVPRAAGSPLSPAQAAAAEELAASVGCVCDAGARGGGSHSRACNQHAYDAARRESERVCGDMRALRERMRRTWVSGAGSGVASGRHRGAATGGMLMYYAEQLQRLEGARRAADALASAALLRVHNPSLPSLLALAAGPPPRRGAAAAARTPTPSPSPTPSPRVSLPRATGGGGGGGGEWSLAGGGRSGSSGDADAHRPPHYDGGRRGAAPASQQQEEEKEREPEPEPQLDLHGQHAAEAVQQLREWLPVLAQGGAGRVRVVTGIGAGGGAQAPMRRAVYAWLLKQQSATARGGGGGAGAEVGVRGVEPMEGNGGFVVRLAAL